MKKITFILIFLLALSLVYAQEVIENAKNEPIPKEDIPVEYPQQQTQTGNVTLNYEEDRTNTSFVEQVDNKLLPSEPMETGPIVNESESVQYNIPADLKEAIKSEKMKEEAEKAAAREAENIEIVEPKNKSTVVLYIIGVVLGVIVLFALLKKLIKRDKTTKNKSGKKSKRKR